MNAMTKCDWIESGEDPKAHFGTVNGRDHQNLPDPKCNDLIRELQESGNDGVIYECRVVLGKHLGIRPAWKSYDGL